MGYLRVQGLLQVLQDGSSSYHTTPQVVDTKALERAHIEVLVELLVGSLLSKHPVIQFEGAETGAKVALEVVAALPVVEHLLGLEVANELLHIVVGALARKELTCRDVEESHPTDSLAEVDSTEEIVLLVVEHRVLHSHTRGDQLRDASLHQFLGELGVFQLVADGHAPACTDELGQIGVEGMMGETRHLVALPPCPIVAMGQRDA